MVGYKRTNGACTKTGIETKNADAPNTNHCWMLLLLSEEDTGFSMPVKVAVDAIADDNKLKLNNWLDSVLFQ